jgi:uncharacterized protein (DUF427 family)/transcriptional regulator with XRE-family HTH domain
MSELGEGRGPRLGIRRTELAEFLRGRRARLRPADAGLPAGGRRRTPGLRRQEVAQLAGMSVDYYIRLEQARGPHPSQQILAALARALILTQDERDYLFRIAGASPPLTASPVRELTPAIRYLLDSLAETPAYVVDAKYDVLAWNQLATFFIGDLSGVPEADRNMLRWTFRQPDTDVHWNSADTLAFTRSSVAELRAAYGRYPGDRSIENLVTELLGISPRFAAMWAEHEVEVRRRTVKRFDHPLAGPLEFDCQVLHIPDTDQRLIIYCAAPGSPTREAFRRLAGRGPAPDPSPNAAPDPAPEPGPESPPPPRSSPGMPTGHTITTTPASIHVEVTLGGEKLAESDRPVLLDETGLPTRYYLPRADVRTDLLRPTDHHTICPFKGAATYWSAEVGGEVHDNLVWSYETPIPEAAQIAGLMCFFSERVELVVEGQREPSRQ